MQSLVGHEDTEGTPFHPLLVPSDGSAGRLASNLRLTRELAMTAFRLKYAGSVLGYLWSLVKPFLLFGMMYVFFGVFLHVGSNDPAEEFPVELLLGIVIWNFFSEATTAGLLAVVSNADMIKKSAFARWILVVAASVSAVMTLVLNLGLVLVIGAIAHWFRWGLQSLWFPVLLVEMYVLALGTGFLLAGLFVHYRDLTHIWEVVLQALFFASAILIPFTVIPPKYQTIVALDPITQIVGDLRRSIISPTLHLWSTDILGRLVVVPPLICVGILLLGASVFRLLAPRFGEFI
jgi:ABC-2 type transport system permease protein